MNPQQSIFMYLKLGIVAIVEIAIGAAMLAGKIEVTPAVTLMTIAATGLVAALGIQSAGTAAATAIQAQTKAMVARGEAVDAVDQVKRVPGVLAKSDQRGFVSVRALVGLLVLGSGITIAILGIGDLMGCSALTPQGATDVQVGVNAAACVIVNSAVDVAAGMSPPQVIADLVSKCGASVAQIGSIFDAQASAADKSPASAAQFRALSAAAHSTDGGK